MKYKLNLLLKHLPKEENIMRYKLKMLFERKKDIIDIITKIYTLKNM